MTGFEVTAAIICLAAVSGYFNSKVLRLPSAIGLMAVAMLGSLAVAALGSLHFVDSDRWQALVDRVDFANVLMHGFLGLLLFAGALHVDFARLAAQRWSVAGLALLATTLSTLLLGGATYWLTQALKLPLSLAESLLFGALISPTDPIAVLGILKSARVRDDLAVQISGESLFNDGVGIVLFIVIEGAAAGEELSLSHTAALFAREAVGGALFGAVLGYVAYLVLRSIDDYSVEVLITLAVVLGGYAVAERLHISAPIAAVVSGLVIGNQGRRLGMSDQTRHHVDLFWKLLDEILNAVLFLLLGAQATRLTLSGPLMLAMALVIPLALLARFVSVGITVKLLRFRWALAPNSVRILTWGGLRGGISVALALSLRPGPAREHIVALTYAVVAFSILVQGLSLGPFLRRLQKDPAAG